MLLIYTNKPHTSYNLHISSASHTTSPALFFLLNLGIAGALDRRPVARVFSSMTPSLYAAFAPFLLPVLTSLLLAQQQDRERWTPNPRMLKVAPIHMKTNMSVPNAAPILRPAWLVMTLRKMVKRTVAMMVAATVRRAAIKVQMAIGKLHHLE
jgi:hypothetical protein